MKLKYGWLVLLLSVQVLTCNSLHAEEGCYPDQHPFDSCVDVMALQWDVANSVEELAATSSGTVFVTGGPGPYTWTISGNGFYFKNNDNETVSTIVTGEPSVTIYTGNACGFGEVAVSTPCGDVVGGVRSTNGHWVKVYSSAAGVNGDSSGTPPFPGGCPFVAQGVSQLRSSTTYKTVLAINGNYEIEQLFYRRGHRMYAARRPYDGPTSPTTSHLSAVPTCNSAASHPPTYIDSYKLSGSCFEFEHNCEGCDNECHNTSDEYDFSYDLGYHSLITTDCGDDWGWCLVIGGWSYVTKTVISKWQCN